DKTFQVTVNDTPVVAAPIPDLTVNEDAPAQPAYADLNVVFADGDNLDSELVYAITATTPGGIVTPTLHPNGTLDLSFVANAFGVVDITVRATDPRGLFVEDTFRVTVNSVNDAPTVASPIPDRTVLQDSGPLPDVADLNAVFNDVDNTDAQLTYTITGNTNAALMTPTIEADDTLDLTFAAGTTGFADITVRATDPD